MLDYRNPDYTEILRDRVARLQWMRAEPGRADALLRYYRDHIPDFISDWGVTYDPRNAEIGLPTTIPFILFPKQREWLEWVLDRWHNRERGATVKSREVGVSWLALSLACGMCITREGIVVGFGSSLERNVDTLGDPKSLFWKARFFMDNLPVEFRRGFTSVQMLLKFAATGSMITGDAGKNVGRGGRTSLYFVDEAAHLDHPESVEAALSQTTNCRIDISSVNGSANPFAQHVRSGKIKSFTFSWRDDPRKDEAWYQRQLRDLDPITVAQEIDMDFSASVTGVLIPSAWVQSAIDAHLKLGFDPTGLRRAAMDVADEGTDLCAWAGRDGVLLDALDEWSGRNDDIFGSVAKAFLLTDQYGALVLDYDADGLGAGVRGDARVLNESRPDRPLGVRAFHGSGAVIDPKDLVPSADPNPRRTSDLARRNGDFFKNRKAQEWWRLRVAFERTHRAVQAGSLGLYDPADLISISSKLPLLGKLTMELSQPTYTLDGKGKVVVDKTPDGARSPNLADGTMICYSNPSARRPKIGFH